MRATLLDKSGHDNFLGVDVAAGSEPTAVVELLVAYVYHPRRRSDRRRGGGLGGPVEAIALAGGPRVRQHRIDHFQVLG